MQAIVDSQRSVWEILGEARPWWSVLSAEEFDKRDLSEYDIKNLNYGSEVQMAR